MSKSIWQELAALFDITIEDLENDIGRPDRKDDRLMPVLQAIGIPVNDGDEAEKLLWHLRREHWRQILDPVHVVSEQEMPLKLPMRLSDKDDQQYAWLLTEEGGSLHHGSFFRGDLTVVSGTAANNFNCTLYKFDLSIKIPIGYHRLEIRHSADPQDQLVASQLLIVTPTHCYLPPSITGDSKVWGISTHLHALRSSRNWGIGDFADLEQLLSLCAARGAAAIHTTPITSPSAVNSPNPYVSSCRSQLNALYIHIENVPDFTENEALQDHFNDARFQARLAYLKNQDEIDYEAIAEIKDEIFKNLWDHFQANHLNPETTRGCDFRHFQQQGGDTLHYYAIFSTIQKKYRSRDLPLYDWRNWPNPLRHPRSPEVAEFAQQHEEELEYCQYLQWQAESQLAAIGRRSMELGLKVGLLTELPYNGDLAGFENWYYAGLFLPDAVVNIEHPDTAVVDPAAGQPVLSPSGLKNNLYGPLIESLRHSMRYAGGVVVRSFARYFRAPLTISGQAIGEIPTINYPFSDILGIIALESHRNRSLIIVDDTDCLPKPLQSALQQHNIFTTKILFQARDEQDKWMATEDYPPESVVSTSAPFLASMKGFWLSKDISLKAAEKFFRNHAEKEQAILTRAIDRAHFLINLDHAELLPEGSSLDPAAVPEMDRQMVAAGQILLAKSPAKILLVSFNDLEGIEVQAEPPAMVSQHFWFMRYGCPMKDLLTREENETLFQALCRERGTGTFHPSVLETDRKKRHELQVPIAFYRLQLNKDFTFHHAAEIIPYLKCLGISHCYVSPFLMARPGSSHGYDIIDHCSLNPEIGSREDFERFMAALHQNQMALLLDIVPNHMGIGSDNRWWMDVLENGQTSQYSSFFDINWHPQQPDLAGRVLLPVLGDHYGKTLENEQLTLCFDENSGTFSIKYYQHQFPVDPRTYTTILHHDLERLSARLGTGHSAYLELQNLISSFDNLPDRQETSDAKILIRHRDKEVNKQVLARICRDFSEIQQFIAENVILFNGESGKPQSFDLLHDLLEQQPYRLSFWRVAADEINYRRFFDINDLAGLRMEEIEVFQLTHQLVLDLIATGRVDGLRVDHPDGLYDPYEYFCRLEAAAAGESFENIHSVRQRSSKRDQFSLYVVAEKILADFEYLPDSWPVCGTTGYDFSNLLNGLLLDSSAEKQMTALYHRYIGSRLNFDDLVYTSKKLIISSAMAGELNVLATLLHRLASKSRLSRDFTLNSLRQALIEVVACFPVYRTYIDSENIQKADVQFIEWAVARAKTRHPLDDADIYHFIKGILLLKPARPDRKPVENSRLCNEISAVYRASHGKRSGGYILLHL